MRRPQRPVPPLDEPNPSRGLRLLWAGVLLAAVAPLWCAVDLPMVDLPQHFYVLEVMHRLHDAATVWPHTFELHVRFTPYLGYYAVVGWLHAFLPLELANRLFLSATVAGLPLAMAFLLRSLGRPSWPALLATPFSYGDNFGWGFVNTCAAMPLALLALGAFLRAIAEPAARRRWSAVTALALLAGFFMHPIPTGFLALALPLALLTTRAPDDADGGAIAGWLRRRAPALLATLPLLIAVGVWGARLAAEPVAFRPGTPHAAWGPMLSAANMQWLPPLASLQSLLLLLANVLLDGSDSLALLAVIVLALVAVVAARLDRAERTQAPWPERLRPLGFAAIALGLYLFLPLNIQGSIQYLGPRFAPLVATLMLALIPRQGRRTSRWIPWLAGLVTLLLAVPLGLGFRAFDREASALRRLAPATGERPVIMGLLFDPNSRVADHPVYLHAAAVLARLRGGLPNLTFMDGRQIPVRYRGTPPPSMASEWRPGSFDYASMGAAYDHFLVRGAPPDSLFGARLGTELHIAAHEGDWYLIRRGPASAPASPAPARGTPPPAGR